MNERIKLLADRAIGSMPYDWIQTHDWNIPDEFLEKFAELIVRECIDWCNAHATIDGTAQKIVESIKKDFGVEE